MISAIWARARQISWADGLALGGLGLYAGRVVAEALPGARQPWQALGLTLAGFALAAILLLVCGRLGLPRRPLALLLAYALSPVASPTAAGAIGLATLVAWLWCLPGLRLPRLSLQAVLVVAGLVLYGATVAPGVLPADSGEFQLVAAVLGIAHPPGYPLYTLLGHLATLLPVVDPALALNLLSVLFGALTLGAVAALVRAAVAQTSARAAAWGGALAAMGLALSPTFWSQATTANIRSLTALLTAVCLLLLVRWGSRPTSGRLALCGAAVGLAIGHHSSLALLALPMGAYLLSVEPRLLRMPRRWLPALAACAASFVVLLYLPLRSAMAPPFDPVPVDSFARFWEHVLASGFRGDMLYYTSMPALIERGRVYVNILRLQFGPVLPWAMAISLGWLLYRRWRLGLLLGGVWLVNVASALTYRAPQTVEYLLPSYIAMVACLGCALAVELPRLPRLAAPALLASLSVAVAANGLACWPSFRALHHDRDARVYAETILQQAPRDALVLANWHWATPMWYLQQVEGLRPDVQVEYVYPEGARTNEDVWMDRVRQGLAPTQGAASPVIVTNRFPALDAGAYQLEPVGEAWLVRADSPEMPPAAAIPVSAVLGGQIRIEAVLLDRADLAPGETLRVTLYWRPLATLERDYAAFVQLVGAQGVVGQADRAQPTSSYAPGALRVDTYEVPLLLQTPPGAYSLIAGFYSTEAGGWQRLETADGADHAALGTVSVTAGSLAAATMHPLHVAYPHGVVLRGMDLDRSVAGQARLYLHWRSDGAAPSEPLQVAALGDGQPLATASLGPLAPGQTATLALDLPDHVERVGLCVVDADGAAVRPLGAWGLPRRGDLALRLPRSPERYVPLGGGLAYLGLAQPPDATAPGEPITLRPRFLALRPLLRDYTVSLGLVGGDPRWERKVDGTPAMGAIPTLKWLSGWVVTAPYAPAPPADADPGAAQITLSVYDAFTLAPLAVLDERLARQGQGVFLQVGTVPVVAR